MPRGVDGSKSGRSESRFSALRTSGATAAGRKVSWPIHGTGPITLKLEFDPGAGLVFAANR